MFIKQLSIFIENKAGKLADIVTALAEAGVNIRALTMADTTNYGVVRCIVSDPEKAVQTLSEMGIVARQSNVIAIATKDVPGGLATVLKLLADGGVAIEYMYGFVGKAGESAVMIIRADVPERAMSILQNAGVETVDPAKIYG